MQKADTHLSALDFRTLRFLKYILATGSVTRTAQYLGVSQLAASRILARIRDLTGDPILVRTKSGYQPTDHAPSLQTSLDTAIQSVTDVFSPSHFDPIKSLQHFRIASTDYWVVCVLGPLVEHCAINARGLEIDVVPLVPKSFSDLGTGDIDLMLYADLNVDEGFIARKLFDESYEILFRKGHLLEAVIKDKPMLTAEDLSSCRLIEFNFPNAVELEPDTIMRSEGGVANALFQQPYFAAFPFLMAQGDAVAVLPKRLCQQVTRMTLPGSAPFQVDESFPYHVIRHERSRHNPAMNWLVKQARDLYREFDRR